MTWQMYRWVWRLESPVHLGVAPAGIINRTRLYVPARTLWGALTSEISRREAGEGFPPYDEIGRELRQKVRFTYLYPAQQEGDNWYAWLPRYAKGIGLCWIRENRSNGLLSDRKFRARLLSTIPGTAISPSTDTAEDGTLHEMEYIQTQWKRKNIENSDVAFVGYVFFGDNVLKDKVFHVNELFAGADTRYGFGRLVRMEYLSEVTQCFGKQIKLDQQSPWIKTDTVFAHVGAHNFGIRGFVQLLQQWDREEILISGLAWAPGSFVEEEAFFAILPSGLWKPLIAQEDDKL